MTTVLPTYPDRLAELVASARALAKELGEIPSRNELMRQLHIGGPKARDVRAELVNELTRPDPWDYAEPGPDLDEPTAILPPDPASITGPAPVAPGPAPEPRRARPVAVWPIVLLALPAFVAVWSGWVGLGRLAGFGMVDLLPGIVAPGSWATLDTAITLPIGVETYAAYALYVWLSGRVPDRARRFARVSALGSLAVGALGQVAYHLLAASGATAAPWPITMAVACLPVAVLGMGAALAHLVRS